MPPARPFAALWAFEPQPTPSPLWLHPLRERSALRAQRQAFGQHQPPQCKAFGRFASTGLISGHRARSQTVRGTVWCAGRSRPGRASTRQGGLNSEARHRHGRTHEPPSATPFRGMPSVVGRFRVRENSPRHCRRWQHGESSWRVCSRPSGCPCAALAVVSGLLARRQAVRASSQALKGFRGINRFVSEPTRQAASRPGAWSRHSAIYSTFPCPRFASRPHEGTANPCPMKTERPEPQPSAASAPQL